MINRKFIISPLTISVYVYIIVSRLTIKRGDHVIPQRDICFEVRSLSNLIRRDIEKSKVSMGRDGTNGVHGWAIGYFYNNRECDIFQRDFEEEFSIRRSTASRLLKNMESKGLILRQPVNYDSRLKKIVLTDKAVEIHKKILNDIRDRDKRIKRGVSEEELNGFFSAISKFKANLEDNNG